MKKEILELNIKLFGGGAPGNTTGFSESVVNETIDAFNGDQEAAQQVLTRGLNGILDAIAKNWGTNDGVKHVNENVVPAFEKIEEQAKTTIKQIGEVIKSTALQQAADTHNSITVTPPKDVEIGAIVNNMTDKLDNGYVGVYEDFQTEVESAYKNLESDYNAILLKLQSDIVNNCSRAFTDQGTSAVAQAAETYVGEIQAALKKTIDGLLSELTALAASATKFSKEIQAAGLRSDGGSGAAQA